MIAKREKLEHLEVRPIDSCVGQLPDLNHGAVHLWSSRTDLVGDPFSKLLKTLSSEENQRARRYRFKENQREFVSSRGLLRMLIGRYLDVPPEKVTFEYGEFGKPVLKSFPQLHFNLAHSGNFVLIGFSRSHEIGVDLEEKKSNKERFSSIAEMICTKNELGIIKELNPKDAEAALARLWTAKEAYLKWVGTGLQISPDRIEIPEAVLMGGAAPDRLWSPGAPVSEVVHTLYPLPMCEDQLGCSAALVASGSGSDLG